MDPRATSRHYKQVHLFMEKAAQACPASPCLPSPENRLARARLILEEAMETVEALGCTVMCQDHVAITFDQLSLRDNGKPDLLEIVDGCCDIKVVTTGTLIACGIPDEVFQHIVDVNNLAKFGPGSYKNAHGKLVKPPDFVGPAEEIRAVLRGLGAHIDT